MKSKRFTLTLRKRLFCNAKPTLLPCKTAAFGMQNNRFCNTLVMKMLRSRCSCENILHINRLLSTYVTKGHRRNKVTLFVSSLHTGSQLENCWNEDTEREEQA
ncbi:hypothetical protein CUC04_06495 [Prevotella intermedia]|uniref:Uncharacterized protein n=1 Tax=Prevotella intermedia TaxID=28131 RepID=A0A2G9IH40_PREIN|nr:hypothetical protein CUC04_06495 [Prevotella intermedia]